MDDLKNARMYASNNGNCPVQGLRLYLDKIKGNKKGNFWPKPRTNFLFSSWYEVNQIVGICTLGAMMKNLSVAAKLSKSYTNHCIRPTVVTNLKAQGFRNDEVSLITGHKNQES